MIETVLELQVRYEVDLDEIDLEVGEVPPRGDWQVYRSYDVSLEEDAFFNLIDMRDNAPECDFRLVVVERHIVAELDIEPIATHSGDLYKDSTGRIWQRVGRGLRHADTQAILADLEDQCDKAMIDMAAIQAAMKGECDD